MAAAVATTSNAFEMAKTSQVSNAPDIMHSLSAMKDWYNNMVDPKTKKLIYEYNPTSGTVSTEKCPIRDIGAVWDVEVLSNFLNYHAWDNLIDKWIDYYTTFIIPIKVQHLEALMLDSAQLNEPASIAHSAMMILCLGAHRFFSNSQQLSDIQKERKSHLLRLMVQLADGIIHQQRSDGSYKIFFDKHKDFGVSLYAGEAMLALMTVYNITKDNIYKRSVEHAFPFYLKYCKEKEYVYDDIIFFANWMTQALTSLYRVTTNNIIKKEILKFVYAMHDKVIDAHYYSNLATTPKYYSVVEVACGLEGLTDAYWLCADHLQSLEYQDDQQIERNELLRRREQYRSAIGFATKFLLQVQNKDKGPEHGGFGHSITNPVQRIDVTGHVMNAFVKVVQYNLNNQAPTSKPPSQH